MVQLASFDAAKPMTYNEKEDGNGQRKLRGMCFACLSWYLTSLMTLDIGLEVPNFALLHNCIYLSVFLFMHSWKCKKNIKMQKEMTFSLWALHRVLGGILYLVSFLPYNVQGASPHCCSCLQWAMWNCDFSGPARGCVFCEFAVEEWGGKYATILLGVMRLGETVCT